MSCSQPRRRQSFVPVAQCKKIALLLRPIGYDTVTDRTVQGSINIARHDREAMILGVPKVLDLDLLVVSVRLNERPATVHGEWLWPAKVMQAKVAEIG